MKSLVVDDEMMSRMMLALFLENHGDCVQAASGQEAIALFGGALAAGEPFDLVCLDIGMPGMDGLAAVQQLREVEQSSGEDSTCRIFMMTASYHSEDLNETFPRGRWDEYLLKPFNPEELFQLLKRYSLL